MVRLFCLFVALCVVAVAVIGCSSNNNLTPSTTPTAVTKEPVKIAVIGEEAGGGKIISDHNIVGCQMAAEEINNAGGILGGRPVELHYYDEGYQTEVILRSVKQAIDDGCVAFVNFIQAGQAYPAIEKIKEANLPIFLSYSSPETDLVPGFYDALFRSPSAGKLWDMSVFRYLNSQGVERLASVRYKADYVIQGEKWFDYLSSTTPGWQTQRVAQIWFEWGTQDITAEITKAVATNPEWIYMEAYDGTTAFPAIQRAVELGYQGKFEVGFTALDFGPDRICNQCGDLCSDRVYSATDWWPDPDLPATVAWYNAYNDYASRHNINLPAGGDVAGGYVDVKSICLAMDKAGTDKDTAKIAAAVRSLDYITPYGVKHEVLPTGNLYCPYIYIVGCHNGQTVIIDKVPLTREDYGPPYTAP
jgi:branched-chain amino acid transport system substrate-binding protein